MTALSFLLGSVRLYYNKLSRYMIDWTKYFDHIFCLSLADNIQKRRDCEKEFRRVGILDSGVFEWKITVKNEFYKYITSNPSLPAEKWWLKYQGAVNCTLGHYEIMKQAIVLGYKRILILEDDIRFLKDVDSIEKILNELPDCDICLLDKNRPLSKAPYFKLIDGNTGEFFDYSTVKFWGGSCYALSRRAMEYMVKRQEQCFVPADQITNKVNNLGAVVSNDNLTRMASITNICVQDMSYKKYMNEKERNTDKKIYEEIVNMDDYNMRKFRYTVLTYIFNDYEKVHEILEKDEDAEYVLVTDDPNLKSNTWDVVYDKSLDGLSVFDKCYKVRFNPFDYIHSDICLRVDGSVEIKKSLKPIIDKFEEGGYDMGLMIHPERNIMKDEYNIWVRARNYPQEQADRCLKFLGNMKYPEDYKGLYQGCFVIQRNNEINNKANELTYFTLKKLGTDGKIERLDQTIFSFVLNKYFHNISVMAVGEDLITKSDYMQWYIHKTFRKIPYKYNTIEPFLFNKPVELIKF